MVKIPSVILRVLLIGLMTTLSAGCRNSATTKPSMRDRQDAALRDPFGYSPDMGKQDDVSGGGIFELDMEGLKRDTNHVFNP